MKGDSKADQLGSEVTLKDIKSQEDALGFSADHKHLTVQRESVIDEEHHIDVAEYRELQLGACSDRAYDENLAVEHNRVRAVEGRPFRVGHRLCINWALVVLTTITVGLHLAIVAPTHYEYMTTAKAPAAIVGGDNATASGCPVNEGGLGGTEADFALSVSLLGAGGLIGALLFALLSAFLPLHILFVSAYAVLIAGYLFYAAATTPAYAQVGRFLAGMYGAAHGLLFRTYLSESAEYVARRQGKDIHKVKAPLLSGAFVCVHLGSLVAPGVNAIVTQIPGINQFKAPSWLFVAFSCIVAGFFVFVFKESASESPTNRSFSQLKFNFLKVVKSFHSRTVKYEMRSANALKVSRTMKHKPLASTLAWIACVSAAVFAAGVNHLCFTVIDTLLNPIMSDILGLSATYQSYVFTGLFLVLFIGSIVALVIQTFGLSAWKTAFIGFLLSTVGFIVLMDWHAIGTDSCREYSIIDKNNITAIQECFLSQQCDSEDEENVEGWSEKETCAGVLNEFHHKMHVCLQVDATNASCYWNPMSVVTGKLCITCLPLCRSKDKSLHFAQFIIGVLFVMLAIPLQKISLVMLLTWLFKDKPQGIILGLQVCAMNLLYMVTAPILAELYFNSGHRTYSAMAIPASLSMAVLLGLVVYNSLKKSALNFIMSPVDDVPNEDSGSITDGNTELVDGA